MAADAKIRAQLQDSFTELWDERRAEAVMALITPDLSGLATKEELNRLLSQLRDDQRQLRGEFQAFRSEMREDRHRLRSEFTEFRQVVAERLDQHEAKLDAKFDQHEAQLDARFDRHEARLDAKFDQREAKHDAKLDRHEAERAAGVVDKLDVKLAKREPTLGDSRRKLDMCGVSRTRSGDLANGRSRGRGVRLPEHGIRHRQQAHRTRSHPCARSRAWSWYPRHHSRCGL